MNSTEKKGAEPRKEHRLLFLQTSSIFESYGGIEYYNDDFLTLAAGIYHSINVTTIIPQRKSSLEMAERPYFASFVRFYGKSWLSKIENRIPIPYFARANKLIKSSKPTLLVVGHISLAPTAFLLSKIHKIPYVVIAYGIESWGKLFPQDEWCLRKASGIISISDWTKQILVARGYPSQKVRVVHPRIPASYEKFPRPRRIIRHDPFTLLTISRLSAEEQYKGQDHVLQALALMEKDTPGLKLKYIIQGDGSDRERLVHLAASLGITHLVEFRPPVTSRDELLSSYRAADVFVMPSRFGFWSNKWHGEGFGIVYVEAAMLGVPSVAYRCGGVMDIIKNGHNGLLVPPDNVSELSKALKSLFDSQELVEKLSLNAYDHAVEKFSGMSVAKELVHALDLF